MTPLKHGKRVDSYDSDSRSQCNPTWGGEIPSSTAISVGLLRRQSNHHHLQLLIMWLGMSNFVLSWPCRLIMQLLSSFLILRKCQRNIDTSFATVTDFRWQMALANEVVAHVFHKLNHFKTHFILSDYLKMLAIKSTNRGYNGYLKQHLGLFQRTRFKKCSSPLSRLKTGRSLSVCLCPYTYLARRLTVIMKAVPPGRGSPIALRLGWPLRLPQMWVTR